MTTEDRRIYLREAQRKWYAANKETQRQRVKDVRIAAKQRAREYLKEFFKTNHCVDCGESDPIVLEFDHVSGKKYKGISSIIGTGHSLDVLLKEIDKCVVRCANCHRRKTARDFGWENIYN